MGLLNAPKLMLFWLFAWGADEVHGGEGRMARMRCVVGGLARWIPGGRGLVHGGGEWGYAVHPRTNE